MSPVHLAPSSWPRVLVVVASPLVMLGASLNSHELAGTAPKLSGECPDVLGAGLVTASLGFAERLVAGDVNEDGILDVLVKGSSQNRVLLGQGSGGVGDGTFASGQSWSGGIGNREAELVDVNEDGILDLVQVNATSLEVRLGQGSGGVGDGTFGSATTYAVTSGVAMVSGDFNEDGIVDVAVADGEAANPDQVEVWLGQGSGGVGSGTFGTATPVYTTGNAMNELAAGDFNEDGSRTWWWARVSSYRCCEVGEAVAWEMGRSRRGSCWCWCLAIHQSRW